MNKIKVGDIMKQINTPDEIISVDINDNIKQAVEKIIQKEVHRIIVKRNNNPEKILRVTDIDVKHLNEPIKQIFDKLDRVNIISIDDDIEKIISTQDSQPVSIVYDKLKPVGIITPSDISRYIKKQNVQDEIN